MAGAYLNSFGYNESSSDLAMLIERTLTELDIPLGTTRIGSYAFEAYSALTKITIPETVTKILNHAFHDCKGLTDIVIPDSVTEIGTSIFHGCNNLASVRLSDGIEILPANCFYQCSKLSPLTLPAALEEIKGSALKTSGNGIFDFTKCKVVPILASGAFYTLTDAARIYVPTALYEEWIGATNWAEYAEHILPKPSEGLWIDYGDAWGNTGAHCYSVMGIGSCTDGFVSIPSSYDDGVNGEASVTDLGLDLLRGNSTITGIYIPTSITGIYTYPLNECSSLKRIYFSGIEQLGSFECRGLPALEYVKFGGTVADQGIGGGVFADSSNVTYDFTDCLSVPWLDSYGVGAEFGTDPIILVPADLLDAWKSDTNWVNYADYIVAAE